MLLADKLFHANCVYLWLHTSLTAFVYLCLIWLKITGISLAGEEETHQLPSPSDEVLSRRAGPKCPIDWCKEPTIRLTYSCPCKFLYPRTVGALKASREACMFEWPCFFSGNTQSSPWIADRQDVFNSVKCYLSVYFCLLLSLPSSCWSVNITLALCGSWEYPVVLCVTHSKTGGEGTAGSQIYSQIMVRCLQRIFTLTTGDTAGKLSS